MRKCWLKYDSLVCSSRSSCWFISLMAAVVPLCLCICEQSRILCKWKCSHLMACCVEGQNVLLSWNLMLLHIRTFIYILRIILYLGGIIPWNTVLCQIAYFSHSKVQVLNQINNYRKPRENENLPYTHPEWASHFYLHSNPFQTCNFCTETVSYSSASSPHMAVSHI
jgi:hypothetical protein